MFVHPLMLAGTAMGSAPIIIHLLNRQRYKKITWAAMHWLLAAYKKSARRLQVQDLILLAVRVLILVLLALALARPFLQAGGGLFGAKSHVHRVLVLDTSFSMGYNQGGKTSFDRAKEVARYLTSTASLASGDQVTLITMTDQATARIKASTDLNAVYRDADGAEMAHAGTDVVKSLARAFELLDESAHPRKEIFLVTDLTRCGWIQTESSGEERVRSLEELKKALKNYREDPRHRGRPEPLVCVIDVGAERAQNLTVDSLEADSSIVATRSQVVFKARVRSFADRDQNELPVAFNVDGERVASAVIKVEAGKEGTAGFSYQFEAPGPHWVSAGIEGDRLPVDDARCLAVPVVEHLKLLAVDGELKSSALESETGLLVRVLAPKVPDFLSAQGVKSPSIISAQVISDEALADAQFDGLDLVVLANVPMVSEEKAAQLRSFVKAGGALWIFVGDRVDPALYNEVLLPAGDPLLPAKLLAAKGEAGNPEAPSVSFQPDGQTDAMLPNFGRDRYPLLEMVKVFKRYLVEIPKSEEGAKGPEGPAKSGEDEKVKDSSGVPDPAQARRGKVIVPLRYNDGTPAVVVREYGQGKVALFTTTADKQWNNLPERVAHLPMMNDMVYYLVRPRGARHNLEVGGTFSIDWPPEDYAKEVTIVPPEGHEEEKTSKRPETVGKATVFSYAGPGNAGVRWAGPYKLVVAGEDQPREIFAAGLPRGESDLARIDPAEIRKRLPELKFLLVSKVDELSEAIKAKTAGREFWRSLTWAVLSLAVLETFLAWFFGRNRW